MKDLELPTCEDKALWDAWLSTFQFPALTVADDLGLFPLLEPDGGTVEEVAERLSMGLTSAEALLGVMTCMGFLVRMAGRFYLTEVSRNFLLPASPYYRGPMFQFFRQPPTMPCHEALREALLAPRPSNQAKQRESEHKSEPKSEAQPDSEQSGMFTRAMHGFSFQAAMVCALRANFAGVRRLLDIGGGSGCFCIALALRYPEMSLTVAELPEVCRVARQYIADFGLQNRIDTLEFDMREDAWPSGYDAVFFSNIFHGGSTDWCLQLARKSFEELPSGGRIYVHEVLMNDTRDGPLTPAAFQMAMQFFNRRGDKQFSAREISDILNDSGFVDVSVIPTYAYYSLISGVKP